MIHIDFEPPLRVRAADLREFDRLDLEGDEYADADPDGPRAMLTYEYQDVISVTLINNEGVEVVCDSLVILFPEDHMLTVVRRHVIARHLRVQELSQ